MPAEHGAWFFVPNGEYMWVRFGFDDAHTAARSFLFFTINTVFPRTIFRGVSKTLRQEETEEERFLRLLGEGEQFEGFEELKSSANFTVRMDASRVEQGSMDPPQAYKGQPDEAECFGPYEKNEHVLKEADFEAIRVAIEADVEFIDPLKETIFDILNEMVMSWLEETVVPAASLDSVLLTADALCFESTKRMTLLRKEVKAYMLDPVKHPIPGFDFDAVGRRIKDFLKIRCGNDSLVGNDAFIAGVTSSVRYLVAELIKIASNAYFIPERFTPCDIRLKSHWDVEFQIMFRLCKVYWYGR